MTRQTDILECRIEFLKQFDDYVLNTIGDDDITAYWLEMGLPDGYDIDDLREIALDDDEWLDIVNAFAKCCRMAGVIE